MLRSSCPNLDLSWTCFTFQDPGWSGWRKCSSSCVGAGLWGKSSWILSLALCHTQGHEDSCGIHWNTKSLQKRRTPLKAYLESHFWDHDGIRPCETRILSLALDIHDSSQATGDTQEAIKQLENLLSVGIQIETRNKNETPGSLATQYWTSWLSNFKKLRLYMARHQQLATSINATL